MVFAVTIFALLFTLVVGQKNLPIETAATKPIVFATIGTVRPYEEDCETFKWPKRKGNLLWAEVRASSVYGTTDPEANAAQFCREEGFAAVKSYAKDFECEHVDGEDNDESSYTNWNGNAWAHFPTSSSNRCYVMFKSITCCNDCETFDWPKRRNGHFIWAEHRTSTVYGTADPDINAEQFCKEEGYASVGITVRDVGCDHNGGEDNDESAYTSWDGDEWAHFPTPSANRCYIMFKSITCCNKCDTFNWPKRRNGRLIWAEYRTSTVYGTADPVVNALQFCREEGYLEAGHTVSDTGCEHNDGDDNDESSYTSWDGDEWIHFPTPSANRCYEMFKSITCCGKCKVFAWPKRKSELIWAEVRYSSVYGITNPDDNAEQFCREEGYGLVGYTVKDVDCEHNNGDDNDESSYTSWDGDEWIHFPTPSSNRCYKMFKSITCCPEEIFDGAVGKFIQKV